MKIYAIEDTTLR